MTYFYGKINHKKNIVCEFNLLLYCFLYDKIDKILSFGGFMKKIVIAPDSFKGTISSKTACEIISSAAKTVSSAIETVLIPIADGGEGTIDAIGAKHRSACVMDALFQSCDSFWGDFGNSALIEIATVCGLPMIKDLNPLKTSSYGFGELIKSALDFGKRKIILALGGSSTNDLGCGMAAALGAKFFNKNGESFVPTGGTLCEICRIDISCLDPRIKETEFLTMCDVSNPLYGKNGAAYVFAPQKGATEDMLPLLDDGLRHAAEIIEDATGVIISDLSGAGAAGGLGGASVAFLSSKLKSGIDIVLDLAGFDDALQGADLVITGEGSFDSQSVDGKALSGIAKRAKKAGVPVAVLCGRACEDDTVYDLGVSAVFSILRLPQTLNEALLDSEENLYKTALNVIRLFFAKDK